MRTALVKEAIRHQGYWGKGKGNTATDWTLHTADFRKDYEKKELLQIKFHSHSQYR